MNYLELLVASISTWRLTRMFLVENGPFRIFRRARELSGVVYVDNDTLEVSSFKYEITMCTWCMSVWVGAGVTLLLRFVPGAKWWLLPFTFSAANVVIGRFIDAPKKQVNFPELNIK